MPPSAVIAPARRGQASEGVTASAHRRGGWIDHSPLLCVRNPCLRPTELWFCRFTTVTPVTPGGLYVQNPGYEHTKPMFCTCRTVTGVTRPTHSCHSQVLQYGDTCPLP